MAPVRLHRSELCVPASNVRMMEKAPGLGADIVMLDLEDAVAPADKPQARENLIAALHELDWSGCTVSLRIKGLDTHYCYRDLVDVVEQAGAWPRARRDRRSWGPGHREGVRRVPAGR
jgi:malyl-CoA/(S)-citramalyl-CoA lyase